MADAPFGHLRAHVFLHHLGQVLEEFRGGAATARAGGDHRRERTQSHGLQQFLRDHDFLGARGAGFGRERDADGVADAFLQQYRERGAGGDDALAADRIILSCKVSGVQELIAVYRDLASRSDFALHLGLTEAGIGSKGIVASSAALAVLLQEGIGDTIRISLTPEPGQPRTTEVVVAQELLQTMGLRAFTPMVTACPGCGRTTSTFFQELAQKVQSHVREKMPEWKITHPGAENLTLAVMGCVVNGPGESRHANIGISLPGIGEAPSAPVFEDGQKTVTLRGEGIADEFLGIIDRYVERRYGVSHE